MGGVNREETSARRRRGLGATPAADRAPWHPRRLRDLLRLAVADRQAIDADGLLPPENELMDEFSASRTAIRDALALLVDEGQIERRRGQGTSRVASYIVFDIAVPGPQDIDEYRRLTSGVVPRLLHRSWTPAPAPLARRLTGVATGEPCLAIEYVLNARNEPIAVITNYLRASEGEMVAEVPFVADFYTFLLDAGVDIADQATTLQARLADNEVAPLHDVEVGSPVLAFEQAIRNGRGEVVDVALGVFRDDVRMTASNFVYRPPG
ncbi:MAG TPA: GntR family transcriptional regulator [Microbacterium sp.]|nr:GntR family transcriptional regulator [Microbacterium sp.]